MEDTPKDVLAGFDFSAQGVWAFARPGAPPLKASESLDDAGVVDGALLTLVSVSRTERYRPLVEDVIDAIAVLDESPEFDRTALNRFVGLAIPVAALVDHGDVAGGVVTHRPQLVLAGGARACSGWRCWAAAMLAKNRFDNIDMAESLLAAARAGAGGRRGTGGSAAPRGRLVGRAADCGRRRGGVAVDVGDSWRSPQARGTGVVHGDHRRSR